MPLTKQQLLTPRVLCIGGEKGKPIHPLDCYLTCGDVLTRSNEKSWKSKDFDMNFYFCDEWIEQFPHLFKLIPWWEKREESEYPEYILFTSDYMHFNKGDVYKWESWGKDNYDRCQFRKNEDKHGLAAVPFGHWVEPADLSDYQEYQKQKEA